MSVVLTLNAGSSSVKFALYDGGSDGAPRCQTKGKIDGFGRDARLVLDGQSTPLGPCDPAHVLPVIVKALGPHLQQAPLDAIGHRIVHGADQFTVPQVLDTAMLSALDRLSPLAPLHQPHNLASVRAARTAFPDALQVGCFDTAFHAGQDRVVTRYALPRALEQEGVRRYGFHGLSYDYISGWLAEAHPALHAGRVIVAHLGSGASMCALQGGCSVATTMGFSALDGLPMSTRPGALDPGVMLYLMAEKRMEANALEHMLYHDCGLKGLSGISGDMRVLLASDRPEAREAVAHFVYRCQRAIGSLAAALQGVDGLVFTGGVGENAAEVRAAITARLRWLGFGSDGSKPVLIHATDEEQVIARAALRAVQDRRAQ